MQYRHGVETWPDGVTYVGQFKENKRNGQGVMSFPDGYKEDGEWVDDVFQGDVEE